MGVLDLFKLDGRFGIVTGVSSGLGVAFATALAEAGADLVVCARREEMLRANAEAISKSTGRRIVPVVCDMSKEADVVAMIDRAEKEFGRIDILVNNAGTAVAKPETEITEKEWMGVIDVNLNGVFRCSQEVSRRMIKGKVRGSIINIDSIYGVHGDKIPALPYYASKGGVANMTRAMAVELAPYGIRVNAIAPGFFPSEMTTPVFQDPSILGHIKERTPMGRLGEPWELGGAAVMLASDASTYITGHILLVDGGWDAN
ncbi:MAG TPA: SDR family oxidoreductase [Candidatus Baltobacteraceae bacterium]|nr:SDR family oxidoreductase [Candidatus Baltobacteraceae bacterium]